MMNNKTSLSPLWPVWFSDIQSSTGHVLHSLFSANPSFQKKRDALLEGAECLRESIALMDSQEQDLRLIRAACNQCRDDRLAAGVPPTVLDMELMQHLSDLLNTYPSLEDDAFITRVDLEGFYKDRQAHHAAVLKLVEVMIPETYAAINSAKDDVYTLNSLNKGEFR